MSTVSPQPSLRPSGAMVPDAPPTALAWIASTDHKRTAAKVAVAAFAFFIASGVLALLMRAELAQPGLQVISDDTYNQLFTIHGSGMIYLFLAPTALALALYLVPLQVGAAEIALPRLPLAGFWMLVSGGLTMYSGFLTDGGAGRAGWTAFYPARRAARPRPAPEWTSGSSA